IFERGNKAPGALQIGNRARFGDLKANDATWNIVDLQLLPDKFDETVVAEGLTAKIDTALFYRTRIWPGKLFCQLLERIAHDPAIDQRHQPIALGRGNECAR